MARWRSGAAGCSTRRGSGAPTWSSARTAASRRSGRGCGRRPHARRRRVRGRDRASSTSTPSSASPGREEAETVESGSRAAALGGFTAVVRPARHRPADRLRRRRARGPGAGRRRRCARCCRRPRSRSARRGERLWPRWRSWPRSGCGCSSTRAPACSDPRLMRRALEYAADLGVRRRPAPRGPAPSPAAACMHEGEWSSRLGLPGHPGRGRGADGDARPRPGPAHRRRAPLPAPLDGRLAGHGARRPAAGLPVTVEATDQPRPRSPMPRCAGYDPDFMFRPAAAARARPGRAGGRASPTARVDALATDHSPPARPTPRMLPFDAGAARAPSGLETALALRPRPASTCPSAGCSALLSLAPGRAGRAAPRHGGPIDAGPSRQPLRDRPDGHLDATTRRGGASRARNTPFGGLASCGAGSATRCSRASPSSSTARPSDEPHPPRRQRRAQRAPDEAPMSRPVPAWLALADGTTFEGEAIRCDTARRRHRRRGRLQHGADRLPGGHHRPVLRRADHHLHLPPHRQLRRDAGRRRDPPAVLPGRGGARPGPPPLELAGAAAPSTTSS